MPASPALALRGRVRRLAAGVCACALVALALAPAASAADREITVSATAPAAWEGRAALGVGAVRPGHADAVRTLGRRRVRHDARSTSTGRDADASSSRAVDAGTGDVDLYVYRSDAFGFAGPPVAVSAGDERRRARRRPGGERRATSSRAVSFAHRHGRLRRRRARWRRGPPTIPDVDDPRGRQEQLVSDPRRRRRLAAGRRHQPARPRPARRRLPRLRRPGEYVSRIATAVSFDRGAAGSALGAVSGAAAANPAVAFDADGDALLVTNELPGLGRPAALVAADTARRAARPGRGRRRARSPTGATDERPVLAAPAARRCWRAGRAPPTSAPTAARPSCAGARPTAA